MILRKHVQIKDVTKEGSVIACFATMNVIDKDGDLTLPGFFGKQDVVMLPAHDWKSVPLGKGSIHESGESAIAELKMNLDVPMARDWHSALMFDKANPPALQQYSYGFTVVTGGSSDGGEVDGQKAYRTLRSTPEGKPGCIVHEVSPVLVGAGEGTGTLAVKGAHFNDEIEATMIALENIVGRAGLLADLRQKDGRLMSAAGRERLGRLIAHLKTVGISLEALTTKDEAMRRTARLEINRSLAFEAGI